MITRREMIGTAMAFSVWPRLRFSAAAALPQISKEGAPDDETFWAYVRSEFELAPEFTNLVSVVRGKFTKANREIAFNEATRLNRLPGPFPDPDRDHEIQSKIAGFIGAPTDNIALLRNTTEGVTTVLANWPLNVGDEILTSSAKHGPFYGALAQRAARDRANSITPHL